MNSSSTTRCGVHLQQTILPPLYPIVGTILAFLIYAVGYVSRPIGGIIFGRLGDKVAVVSFLLGIADSLIEAIRAQVAQEEKALKAIREGRYENSYER
jgi:MFS family permease